MKRTYTKEFKQKACELVLKDGIKHAVVAEKLGINKIMLYQWISDYETYGEDAFVGCTSLKTIFINSNALLSMKFSSSTSFANAFSDELKECIIGDDVESIGDYAFYKCSQIKSFRIPNTVKRIGSYAFASCSGLTELMLPESLKEIDSYAFNACSKVTSVKLPAGLTYVGRYAFVGCKSLVSVNVPENITVIYVSHSKDIQDFCDRCIYLQKGKVIFDGTMQETLEKYPEFAK